ncbi:MAG: T9SS type A sorting domain-containing protein [Bacteroidetes bacterium]|nr:T9SS type A sorting domain-containing protein [Bacteroidota bacterium]
MKKLYLVFVCLFVNGFVHGQSLGLVTLEGKQFKLNGSNFYPRVINYEVEISSPDPATTTWQSDGYITPFIAYGDNGGTASEFYECADKTTCDNQLQNDFNYIAGMGFNTVRIAAFFPRYRTGQLEWQGRQHNNGWFSIPLAPNNATDPGMQFMFNMYENLLTVAENTTNAVTLAPQPLKVIFIMIGQNGPFDSPEVAAYNDFLRELSIFIAASPHKNTVLAYDLWNEPCYEDEGPKTKEETCTIIRDWYNTAKSNDPDHLITLGSCGVGDIMKYDPGIIKVDFISVHTYPSWKPFEDRNDPYYQALAVKRVYNELYWINESSPCPWIIGETGFTASNFHTIAEGLYGTVADQDIFAQQTLEAVCNCGGSGYSWWAYQDTHWPNPNFPGGEFFGLLERDYVPSAAAEKDAVTTFRNYVPAVTGPCPVDYSPAYDANKIYYNSYLYPPNPTQEITRTVIDQNGNPVKDAVVGVHFDMGQHPAGTDNSDFFYTMTDENGQFTAISYDYAFPQGNSIGIAQIKISAAGSERLKWGWCPGCVVLPPSPITLKKIDFNYDGVLQNQTLTTSTFPTNYKGWNTLTLTNVDIQTGFAGNFTARKEVKVNSEFHAANGAEVHIYCQPQVFSDCNDFQTFLMQRQANNLSNNSANNEKEIEISFDKIVNAFITIFPNPNNGVFTVQLHDNNAANKIETISITNSMGSLVYSEKINNSIKELNLLHFSKGIYHAKIITSSKSEIKKIIIN